MSSGRLWESSVHISFSSAAISSGEVVYLKTASSSLPVTHCPVMQALPGSEKRVVLNLLPCGRMQ